MRKTVTLVLLIAFATLLNPTQQAKLVRFQARAQAKGTAERDYMNGYKMIHHGNSKWSAKSHKQNGVFSQAEHEGIYALTLSQDRNKVAFFVTLELGDTKEPVEFMIDTGKTNF